MDKPNESPCIYYAQIVLIITMNLMALAEAVYLGLSSYEVTTANQFTRQTVTNMLIVVFVTCSGLFTSLMMLHCMVITKWVVIAELLIHR